MLDTSPKLSICIPTYKRKDQLKRMIDSLLLQCIGKNIEICVSDNASNDGTKDYCQQLELQAKYVNYHCQIENIGFASNFLTALNMASGEYLWMLGDDEIIHPKAVSRILSVIEKENPSWLLCNFVKIFSAEDDWVNNKGIFSGGSANTLALNEMLDQVGIWSSFMSINIIKKDRFKQWLNNNKELSSEYIGFDIVLSVGQKGGCFYLDTPILARVKESLSKHRFNQLKVYMFEFFDPIDLMVKQGAITKAVRRKLTKEMFYSMAGFLLLKIKLDKGNLPKLSRFIRYHYQVPMFWLIMFPLLLMPSTVIRYGVILVGKLAAKNKNSKLRRLITALEL